MEQINGEVMSADFRNRASLIFFADLQLKGPPGSNSSFVKLFQIVLNSTKEDLQILQGKFSPFQAI